MRNWAPRHTSSIQTRAHAVHHFRSHRHHARAPGSHADDPVRRQLLRADGAAFLDTPAQDQAAVREIEAARRDTRASVFSSIVDESLRARLKEAEARVFDIFDTYPPLSAAIPHRAYRAEPRYG